MLREGLHPQIHHLRRFGDKDIIDQTVAIIAKRANEGLMVPRSARAIRRMARKGNATALVIEESGTRKVVGFAGITHEYRKGILRKVEGAEFGALATAPGYEGNGFAQTLTCEVADTYVNSRRKSLWRTGDFVLFAMAHVNNTVSNNLFHKLGGRLIANESLPQGALDEGADYNSYDITKMRRLIA